MTPRTRNAYQGGAAEAPAALMSTVRAAGLRAATLWLAWALWLVAASWARAQQSGFHDAPASSQALANPYQGVAEAQTGRELYGAHCASCHGGSAQGSGAIPPLAHSAAQTATDGELFWFITTGSVKDGMPSWSALPEQQRWQLVTYLKTLNGVPGIAVTSAAAPAPIADAPPPTPPFTDFRFERPGNTRRITVNDLPAPLPALRPPTRPLSWRDRRTRCRRRPPASRSACTRRGWRDRA